MITFRRTFEPGVRRVLRDGQEVAVVKSLRNRRGCKILAYRYNQIHSGSLKSLLELI